MVSAVRVWAALRKPRFVLPLAAIVLAAGVMWFWGADERRVNHACDTWLEHREDLRWVVSETREAGERAQARDANHVSGQYNDLERALSCVDQWHAVGPAVLSRLHGSADASGLERGAHAAFESVDGGLTVLEDLIHNGSPSDVAEWLPEMGARFQFVDDVCLVAARQ